jgi:hypothetical protein
LIKRITGFGVSRQRTALDAEGRGNQSVAKQQTLLLYEREDTSNLSVPFGKQVMGLEPKNVTEDSAPPGTVKERCAFRGEHKFIP